MQFAVIGMGTFGRKVARTLVGYGASVIVIDQDKEKIEDLKDEVAVAISLNSTDEEAMRSAEIENVDAAVVALGEAQEEAILTTAILNRMGIHPIVARAANTLYAHVLKAVGADRVIVIEDQMGEDEAKRLIAPAIHDKIVLSTGHILVEMAALKPFIGKTLKAIDIRRRFGLNVVAIHTKTTQVDDEGRVVEQVRVNDLPGPDDVVGEKDVLMIVGAEKDIEKLTLSSQE
ncbi:TrkA family potassium uptake protein [bacterium]|nr:TrkA family potassium uptake protein [bacterium]